MTYVRLCIAITAGAVLFALTALQAQSTDKPKSDEYLLFGNVDRGAGEPWVVVNPKDPKNILVAAMATLNVLPTGETPVPHDNSKEATLLRVKELSVPDGSRTDIAVTRDGGKTWTFSADDFRKVLNKNRCSDSFAGSGPDGALYMGCLAYLDRGAAFKGGYYVGGESIDPGGGTAIARSDDKGKTWGQPVWVHPLKSPSLYDPKLKPLLEEVSPTDRPMFVADASTGTIYLTGTGSTYTVDPSTVPPPEPDPDLPGKAFKRRGRGQPQVTRRRTVIRASHDEGKTWGVIYATDNDDYPGGGFGGGVSAAFGHLVVTYSAMKVPASVNATCPCTVLGVSNNDGKSFDYKIIPPLPADLVPPPPTAGPGRRGGFGFPGGAMLAADPTKEGRYAIARSAGKRMYVSITEDSGDTWSQPVLATEAPEDGNFSQRAMKYSPEGVLGIIYKAAYADRSFDMWSAVSKDGGHTFHTVRVSHAVSPPYINDRGNFMFGDDLSDLDLDKDNLYVVWGDNRAGFEGTWFGKVPLSAY